VKRLVLAAFLVVSFGALAAPSSADHQDAPYRLTVASHGLTARATLGSFCQSVSYHDGTGSSFCGDAAYPLDTRGRVPAHPGGRVVLETNYPARSVSVAPVHFSKDGERFRYGESSRARPKGDRRRRCSGRRHRARGCGARTGSVGAPSSGGGDASFWAGFKVHPRHSN